MRGLNDGYTLDRYTRAGGGDCMHAYLQCHYVLLTAVSEIMPDLT